MCVWWGEGGGGGGFTKNQYTDGDCLKTELGQFADLRKGLARKRGGGEMIPQCTLCTISSKVASSNRKVF